MSLIFSSILKQIVDGLTIRIVIFMCTSWVLKFVSKHYLLVNKSMIIKGFPDSVQGTSRLEDLIIFDSEINLCRMPTTSICLTAEGFFPPGGYIYSTKVSMYFFTEFLQMGVVGLIEAFPGTW